MARKDRLRLDIPKGGLKRVAHNSARAGKEVPLGVAKELCAIVSCTVREATGAKKHKEP